jgi:hypothetical protein
MSRCAALRSRPDRAVGIVRALCACPQASQGPLDAGAACWPPWIYPWTHLALDPVAGATINHHLTPLAAGSKRALLKAPLPRAVEDPAATTGGPALNAVSASLWAGAKECPPGECRAVVGWAPAALLVTSLLSCCPQQGAAEDQQGAPGTPIPFSLQPGEQLQPGSPLHSLGHWVRSLLPLLAHNAQP